MTQLFSVTAQILLIKRNLKHLFRYVAKSTKQCAIEQIINRLDTVFLALPVTE